MVLAPVSRYDDVSIQQNFEMTVSFQKGACQNDGQNETRFLLKC